METQENLSKVQIPSQQERVGEVAKLSLSSFEIECGLTKRGKELEKMGIVFDPKVDEIFEQKFAKQEIEAMIPEIIHRVKETAEIPQLPGWTTLKEFLTEILQEDSCHQECQEFVSSLLESDGKISSEVFVAKLTETLGMLEPEHKAALKNTLEAANNEAYAGILKEISA